MGPARWVVSIYLYTSIFLLFMIPRNQPYQSVVGVERVCHRDSTINSRRWPQWIFSFLSLIRNFYQLEKRSGRCLLACLACLLFGYSNMICACIEKEEKKKPETWPGKTLNKKTRRQKTLDLDQRETFLSRHFSSSGPHWWLSFGLLSVCTAWKAITNKEETKTKQKPKEEEEKKNKKKTTRKIIYTKAFSL